MTVVSLQQIDNTQKRCPHVVNNGIGYECRLLHATVARDVCDEESLRRWCLDGVKHVECCFYRRHEGGKR